jgi:citrate synthase
VCDSALTQIRDGQLFYRGQDAVALAGTSSLSEIAALLWTGERNFPLRLDWALAGVAARPIAQFPAAALAWLGVCLDTDPAAWDLRPETVRRTGLRIVSGLGGLIDARVGENGWTLPGLGNPPLIEFALGLCADHELNASAFTARCVAGTGANPYACVIAALCALSGPRHGGATARVESLLDEIERSSARDCLLGRLKRGEAVSGFGHRLYPNGDARARALLERLEPDPKTSDLLHWGSCLLHEHPSIDLALVLLCRQLGLPAGSAFSLFALGRSVGWLAHVLEQYASGQMIRPGARSV